MKNRLHLISLLILLFFDACKKCDEKQYPLSQKQLDFTNFKEGSYWIMRDSISGDIDSILLISNITRYSPDYSQGQCSNQIQIREMEFLGYNKIGKIMLIANGNLESKNDLWIDKVGSSGSFNLKGSKSSYTLNGKTYNNVYTATNHYTQGDSIETFTVVDTDSFFVKIKMFSASGNVNQIWELQKAKIAK